MSDGATLAAPEATVSTPRQIHSTPKELMTEPRVASGAPIRMHIIDPPVAVAATGGASLAACAVSSSSAGAASAHTSACGCDRQHLERGKEYMFCTCGLSPRQPFCDGHSCVGTRFTPLPFTCTQAASNTLLCPCKRTKDPPYCDGSHVKITWEDLKW